MTDEDFYSHSPSKPALGANSKNLCINVLPNKKRFFIITFLNHRTAG